MRQKLVCSICLVFSVMNYFSYIFYGFQNCLTLIELDSLLSVIAVSDSLSCHYSSRVWLFVASYHIKECRLADAVFTDDTDTFTFFKYIIEVFEYCSITIRL